MAKKFNIHDWQAKRLAEAEDEKEKEKYTGLAAEVAKYVGGRFASWMSPGNPPFGQEYNKPPYFDKFIEDLMKVINDYEGGEEIDEQNSLGAAGSDASFNTGNSMAYMPNNTFKKKNK